MRTAKRHEWLPDHPAGIVRRASLGRPLRLVTEQHGIVRIAVATADEAAIQGADKRMAGHKLALPFVLAAAHGLVSSLLARPSGFAMDDVGLIWRARGQMFEHDRAAARGQTATHGRHLFKRNSELGNAPPHSRFERLQVARKPELAIPRRFDDYAVSVDRRTRERLTLDIATSAMSVRDHRRARVSA